jgi:hypothetical protein
LSVGRKTRVVPQAIKRALWARDKGCRFPGCRHTRYVDAHHIEHWSAGGETSLENLMLLCSRHHALVHEGGFRIEKDYRDRWFFRRPDGRAVPSCGYRAADMTDNDVDDLDAAAEYLDKYPSAEVCARLKSQPSGYSPSMRVAGRNRESDLPEAEAAKDNWPLPTGFEPWSRASTG